MKKYRSLICLLLALCLLLTGCRWPRNTKDPTKAPDTAAPTETEPEETTENITVHVSDDGRDPSISQGDAAMIRWQNKGARDYLPEAKVDLKTVSEMEYVRPDVATMYADFDSLIEDAATVTDAQALLDRCFKVFDQYTNFATMKTLANIRYSINNSDAFYRAEYDFCEAESPNVSEKMERLNKALAAGPTRERLEALYFGEGYFLKYDDYEVYTNPEYLALAKQEKELLTQYRDLVDNPTIEYDGEEQSFEELLGNTSGMDYLKVLKLYYNKYNPLLGELFIELVKVRKQLAAVLGYETYAAYSYDIVYERDYTPEQGAAFVQAVETELVPIYEQMQDSRDYRKYSSGFVSQPASEEQVREMVRTAAMNIGGAVADAYRFLELYDLADLTQADEKTNGSFMTYIYDYESPFIMVNSTGTGSDYSTFAHEFGHFTDAFFTYGADEDLETAETFSQSMEFLAVIYCDTLSSGERDNLLYGSTADLLTAFISQAAFAKFEQLVYELPDEELTLENVNGIYRQVAKDFGYYERTFDFYYSQSWVDVLHFFEVPYYVISYCVSAETALQVYRIETEKPGKGLITYFNLLARKEDEGIQRVAESAGLENPFNPASMERTAAFLTWALGLEE